MTKITRFEDTPEFKAFSERYAATIGSEENNPYFIVHDSPLRDKSLMDGHWVLNFGSYNYAGMSGRPEVSEAAIDAIHALTDKDITRTAEGAAVVFEVGPFSDRTDCALLISALKGCGVGNVSVVEAKNGNSF